MPERIPLVYNSNSGTIEEVATSDEVNVGIITANMLSNPNVISSSIELSNTNFNYAQFGPVTVGSGATITVGAGVSYSVL
jgi:hypothetical protein|tara:strand:+ start:827 stop:1066 length:240 start_codon:yes stop_codon:yes gene_type:complete